MKYRSYYKDSYGTEPNTFIEEFNAPTDQIALMISKRVEPYPELVVRVEGDKEVIIKELG